MTRTFKLRWMPGIFMVFFAVISLALAGFCRPPESCTTDPESGVQKCQITSEGQNMITYYDTPLYSEQYGEIVYTHHVQGAPPQIILAKPDGSDARTVAYGQEPTMGPDGANVYFISKGRGGMGMDLFRWDIAQKRETRLTKMDARAIIRYSVTKSGTPHGALLLYSADNIAHLVYADGTGDRTLKLSDPYTSAKFHRLRLSPTHPNLMFYNREVPGQRNLFCYDIDSNKTYTVTEHASHMLWAPDGLHIAYTGGPDHRFYLTRFDGTGSRALDPDQREGTNYCSFAPEGDALACSNWGPAERFPMPGSIFLLAADGSGNVLYVAKHDSKGISFWGEPALEFFKDRYHIIFRSDSTGSPQIYVLTLPHDIYARLHKQSGTAHANPMGQSK